MSNPTAETVTVALDVHKSSLRLAAVRADELLDERTLPYDHAAVERAISRWPGARVCYPGPARGQCRLALPAAASPPLAPPRTRAAQARRRQRRRARPRARLLLLGGRPGRLSAPTTHGARRCRGARGHRPRRQRQERHPMRNPARDLGALARRAPTLCARQVLTSALREMKILPGS